MSEAREVMDRFAAAMSAGDLAAMTACYAPDVIAVTPDVGEMMGREAISDYLQEFANAFPDMAYEYARQHDAGNVVIDEGYITGTNTGPLVVLPGETLPPTGKQIRMRSCDIAEVEDGLITSHRFYFDQLDFLGQLGLLPDLHA